MNPKALTYITYFALVSFASCRQPERIVLDTGEPFEVLYDEKHRAQFHFTPAANWMNDPNGMFYLDGVYHLFYQHYPDSTVWGPMHWGHAVSKDLVKWEHLPIALYPDSLGYIFSGSAVVDSANTSGLGTFDNPPVIAIYTYHNPDLAAAGAVEHQYQGIAFSLDKGRSWQKYQGNPVLDNPGIRDFRDPKVFWYEPDNHWVMVLAVQDHVSFYASDNLIDWEFRSDFGVDIGAHGGVWECPDLFELPIAGTDTSAWVLLVSINPGGPNGGSATQYFTGTFDGNSFTTDAPVETKWIDYGTDNYAGVTWSNAPDNRRIFIGWMSNWDYATRVPTTPWRSAMTIPRELSLKNGKSGLTLLSYPVKEVSSYRETLVEPDSTHLLTVDSLSDVKLSFRIPLDGKTAVTLKNRHGENLSIVLDRDAGQVYIDRSGSGETGFFEGFGRVHSAEYEIGEEVFVRIILDVSSVEVFIDRGALVMTDIFFPQAPFNQLSFSEAPVTLDVYGLQSIWAN